MVKILKIVSVIIMASVSFSSFAQEMQKKHMNQDTLLYEGFKSQDRTIMQGNQPDAVMQRQDSANKSQMMQNKNTRSDSLPAGPQSPMNKSKIPPVVPPDSTHR